MALAASEDLYRAETWGFGFAQELWRNVGSAITHIAVEILCYEALYWVLIQEGSVCYPSPETYPLVRDSITVSNDQPMQFTE